MTISNINGSYSSSAISGSTSTRKGISGLASGLNTDEIIEALTSGTQGKISKLQQNQQKLVWQTEAYRSITDKLVGFSQKYLSSSSPTYMLNPTFFENATIRALGANAGAVSVTGSSSSIKDFQVNSIDKLATTAGFTSNQNVSSQTISTGDLTPDMFNYGKSVSKLEGESINVTYNHTRYDIHIENVDLSSVNDPAQKAAIQQFTKTYTDKYNEAIAGGSDENAAHEAAKNAALDEPLDMIGSGQKVGDVLTSDMAKTVKDNVVNAVNKGIQKAGLEGKIEASYDSATGKFGLKVLDDGNSNMNSTLTISGIGKNAANYLGLDPGSSASEGQTISGKTNLSDPVSMIGALDVRNMKESLTGHSFVFDLDGVKKTITFGDFAGKDKIDIDDVYNDLSSKLLTAFGDKVKVIKNGNHFEFTAPGGSSILSVASGDSQVTGTNGALGLKVGSANRLLLDKSLESLAGDNLNGSLSSLFKNLPKAGFTYDDKGKLTEITNTGTAKPVSLKINDTTVEIFANAIRVTGADGKVQNTRIDGGPTMRNMMDAVNNSDAGVTMKYNSTTDNFTLTAKESGSYGKSEVLADGGLGDALFGLDNDTDRHKTKGEDAELTVSFDGGKTPTKIIRSSNTFSLNGMNLTLNSVFGKTGGTAAEPVKFEAKMNTDDIVKNIKGMVTDYNEIVKLVNDQFSTKPDKSYAPLTDAQRKQMSPDQIKAWDDKAKQGILFNDPDLRSLTSDIRFAFSFPVDGEMLSSIGISTSKNWEDNGQLTIDEGALQKALQERPDDVMSLFAKKDTGKSDGGAMSRLKDVIDKYAATTGNKGILVEKAGNSAAPLSMMQNSMQTRMDDVTKQIKDLQSQLKVEQDRYYNQFSNLEVYISKMNAQSGWLQQQQGS